MKEDRFIKLIVVKDALRKWQKTPTTEDWKTWVANEAGVDLRFITGAVTKGEIVPPKGNLIDEIVKKNSTDEDSARKLRASLQGASPARQRLIIDALKWQSKWRSEHPRKSEKQNGNSQKEE